MSKSISSKLISIGKVAKAHGVRGELKFFLYNKESDLLLKKIDIWFKINNEFESYIIEFTKGLNGEIVKLKSVDDRNSADLFKGKEFFVLRKDFPQLDEGSFYLNDIIGYKAYNDKLEIGKISDILNVPSGNIIEIKLEKKRILVPMVDKYIELFDFKNKSVIMKDIEELIDL